METSEKSGDVVSDPNASNQAPSTALLLDTAITKVDAVAAAHDTLASKVDAVAVSARVAHDTLAERVSGIEDAVNRISSLAQQLSSAHAGTGLVQEIVVFLHRLFPGHGAPGDPAA